MFCSQFDEPMPVENPSKLSIKKQRRNKKKLNNNKQGKKKFFKKTYSKLACNMSSWAESFTAAATWQLKHQVAFWKARAKALEYENGLLHDIVRKNYTSNVKKCTDGKMKIDNEVEMKEEMVSENEDDDSDHDNDVQEEDIEISEEYIQFLNANAKFREDAKRERERLKAKEEAAEIEQNTKELERESVEDTRDGLKELYGERWQKISALEMSFLSSFINECDQRKAGYWPNIPLNLG